MIVTALVRLKPALVAAILSVTEGKVFSIVCHRSFGPRALTPTTPPKFNTDNAKNQQIPERHQRTRERAGWLLRDALTTLALILAEKEELSRLERAMDAAWLDLEGVRRERLGVHRPFCDQLPVDGRCKVPSVRKSWPGVFRALRDGGVLCRSPALSAPVHA